MSCAFNDENLDVSPILSVEEEKCGAKSFGGNVLAPLIDKLNWRLRNC
jgi:hypothetical protein